MSRCPLLLLALALVLAAGCTRTGSIQVRGVSPLHVNKANESTPVNLRLYQLKNSAAFTAASVDDLWTKGKQVLGEELAVDPLTIAVLPGSADDEPDTVQLGKLEPGVSHIGILGLFRKADAEDQRKAIVAVEDLPGTLVECQGYSITLGTP